MRFYIFGAPDKSLDQEVMSRLQGPKVPSNVRFRWGGFLSGAGTTMAVNVESPVDEKWTLDLARDCLKGLPVTVSTLPVQDLTKKSSRLKISFDELSPAPRTYYVPKTLGGARQDLINVIRHGKFKNPYVDPAVYTAKKKK